MSDTTRNKMIKQVEADAEFLGRKISDLTYIPDSALKRLAQLFSRHAQQLTS